MAWVANAAVQAQNIISTIATNLTANGWTLTDRTQDGVWHSTNNQGVTQYIQITQSGTYTYIQFQMWQAWNTGTHAGANGSGTSVYRIYLNPTAIGATATVDLYGSYTANRAIVVINGQSNYRNWVYFGGLDSLAGAADPFCAVITGSYVASSSPNIAAIFQWAGGGSYWQNAISGLPVNRGSGDQGSTLSIAQLLGNDFTQYITYPVPIYDAPSTSSLCYLRGNLDGVLYCPIGSGTLGHMDTISVGGVTHLVLIPGGNPTGASSMSFHGSYAQGVAIAEA